MLLLSMIWSSKILMQGVMLLRPICASRSTSYASHHVASSLSTSHRARHSASCASSSADNCELICILIYVVLKNILIIN